MPRVKRSREDAGLPSPDLSAKRHTLHPRLPATTDNDAPVAAIKHEIEEEEHEDLPSDYSSDDGWHPGGLGPPFFSLEEYLRHNRPNELEEALLGDGPNCPKCEESAKLCTVGDSKWKGNAGRLYYMCRDKKCSEWIMWADHVGVDAGNPPCKCGRPSRRNERIPGVVTWQCVDRRCDDTFRKERKRFDAKRRRRAGLPVKDEDDEDDFDDEDEETASDDSSDGGWHPGRLHPPFFSLEEHLNDYPSRDELIGALRHNGPDCPNCDNGPAKLRRVSPKNTYCQGGRLYFTCEACQRWIMWADDVGIAKKNPECDCGRPSRREVYKGEVTWQCVDRRCDRTYESQKKAHDDERRRKFNLPAAENDEEWKDMGQFHDNPIPVMHEPQFLRRVANGAFRGMDIFA